MGLRKYPRYVEAFLDRHDKPRHYLRRPGFKRMPLPGLPYSPDFMAEYYRLMGDAAEAPRITIGAKLRKAGSLGSALGLYFGSVAFTAELAADTQRSRRSTLEKFARRTTERSSVPLGERQLATLDAGHFAKIVGTMPLHPRRNLIKAIRHFAKWACTEGLIHTDPTAGMKIGRAPKSKGFRPWDETDIAKFEAAYPIGSKQRLAFSIMLFLGLRRSDVVRFGPQHVRDYRVNFTPKKTSRSTGFTLQCPLHPELAKIIAATPVIGTTSYLISERSKPFTVSGFSGFMSRACEDAELPEANNHGLRKACLRRLADAGCDVLILQSISGHADLKELMPYIADRDQRLAAERAVAAQIGTKGGQELPNRQPAFGKKAKNLRQIKGGKP